MTTTWNLGNTTLRNPNRIEQGLRVFSEEFQGRLHGDVEETAFAVRLIEEGIVDSEGSELPALGRKWRSAFTKLGFATNRDFSINGYRFSPQTLANSYPDLGLRGLEYELTPAGQHLLDANTTGAIQDVYLRQLTRHEIPNPIEHEFHNGQMKPFIFLLQVLVGLEQNNAPGISKIETAIFIQPFQNHTLELVENTVQAILQFRNERQARQGNVQQYDDQRLNETQQRFNTPSTDTLLTYADTTFRYSRMSGLIEIRGRSSVVIKPEKATIVTALLENEPQFLAQGDPQAYLADFYRGSGLPTDDLQFSLEEVQRLDARIREFNEVPLIDITQEVPLTIQDSEIIRYTLLEQLSWLHERQFAVQQREDDSISNILQYLNALNSPQGNNSLAIVDRPTFLEWAVWRGFLAIDHITRPIHETRRFPIDDSLMPRHPAPGGGADMIFEFEDFILAVEVTLTSSSRQLSAEGEPVRRHVAQLKEGANKEVYCLFIAPTIDNNTAETFRIGVWYRGEVEDYLNIIPLTLSQFIAIIELLLSSKYRPNQLQLLLDKCLSYRNAKAPEWKRIINATTNTWIGKVSAANTI